MTGSEALAIHLSAQDLLRQQITALSGSDLDQAEALGVQISQLLNQVPERLDQLDEAMRLRLLEVAQATAHELARGVAALDQLRRQRIDQNARAERDGAAARRYMSTAEGEPARFLDERR
jgi:hypothetical protein